MEFLRKHYEKILLSVVLVGLAAAAALLPLKVAGVREDLDNALRVIDRQAIKPLPPLNMSTNLATLKRAENPPKAGFGEPGHNLFNPLRWIRKTEAGGTGPRPMIPQEEFGLSALSITNLTPLYTKIQYRGCRGVDQIAYNFLVTREAATNATARQPQLLTLPIGGRTNLFAVKGVTGPTNDPAELALELTESKRVVSVSTNKPYSEVAGYLVHLQYQDPAERKAVLLPAQRLHQKLTLSGNSYNIVDIAPPDVTLEDAQTKKRTTIRWKTTP
jgi:hypothetical protein